MAVGTGKTHSMEGKDEPPELRGIIPQSFDHIFATIEQSTGMQFLVRASYLEIYNEQVTGLTCTPQDNLNIAWQSYLSTYA